MEEKYPNSQYLDEARFVLAQALHRLGELKESLEILEGLAESESPEILRLGIEQEIDAVKKAILLQGATPESSVTGQVGDGASDSNT